MTLSRGFTLIELLVAMAVLGLISVSLLGSLRFGAVAWQRSDAQGSAVEQTELAESVLRRALSSTYPYLSISDPTDPHILFDGTASRISFLGPAPEALGGAGLARFALSVDASGHGQGLTIAATPELAVGDAAALPPSMLVDGLDHAEFAYYGALEPGSEPAWHDSWTSRFALPQLIRISGAFEAGDRRHWPTLVVAPRIAVDEGCVLDLLASRCQGR